jgi:hypothetical protein
MALHVSQNLLQNTPIKVGNQGHRKKGGRRDFTMSQKNDVGVQKRSKLVCVVQLKLLPMPSNIEQNPSRTACEESD